MTISRIIQSQPVTSESTVGNEKGHDRVSTGNVNIGLMEKCATCNEIHCTLQGQNNRQIKLPVGGLLVISAANGTTVCASTCSQLMQDTNNGVSWTCSECKNKTLSMERAMQSL